MTTISFTYGFWLALILAERRAKASGTTCVLQAPILKWPLTAFGRFKPVVTGGDRPEAVIDFLGKRSRYVA